MRDGPIGTRRLMTKLDRLEHLPPWEWPQDASTTLGRALSNRSADIEDRLRAARLAALCATPDEALADALLAVFEAPEEPEELRVGVTPALSLLLTFAELERIGAEVGLPELDVGLEELYTIETVERIARALRDAYQDASASETLRQRSLAAACRWPDEWQDGAIAAAWSSDEPAWRRTAVSCMRLLPGFDEQVLQALAEQDPEFHALALLAAGEHELAEAWPHVEAVLEDPSADRELLAAALQAAASLDPVAAQEHVDRHLDSDDELLAAAAEQAMEIMELRVPPEELDAGDWPAPGREEGPGGGAPPNLPDRRAMESLLSGFGGRPKNRDLAAAQDLMYQAFDEPDPERRRELARRALETSEDCADAWVLIAEEASRTANEVLESYARGVAAGESALGPKFFEEHAGHFWGLLETRPYMRARFGLAQTLHGIGVLDEALEHYRELLRLNPGDNQGVRLPMLDALLEQRLDEEAAELLARFEDDVQAGMAFGAALLAYRAEGDSETARERLKQAVERNAHVPSYLSGKRRIPKALPPYMSLGGESEAASVAISQRKAWRDTHGALPWLTKRTGKAKRRRK